MLCAIFGGFEKPLIVAMMDEGLTTINVLNWFVHILLMVARGHDRKTCADRKIRKGGGFRFDYHSLCSISSFQFPAFLEEIYWMAICEEMYSQRKKSLT